MGMEDDRLRDNLEGVTKRSTARFMAEKGVAASAYVKRHAQSSEDECLLLSMLGLAGDVVDEAA